MSRLNEILRRCVWLGLLAIVVLSPTQYGVEIAKRTYVSIADPLIWVVFALWLVTVARGIALRRLCPPPAIVLLFILVAVLSATQAIRPLKSAKDIFQMVEYFVVVFMLFANAPDVKQVPKLLNAFMFVASLIVLFGLVQYFSPGIADFRVCATFGNRNVFGGYLSLAVPLMAGVALYETAWWRKAWLLTIVALSLLITLSGAAMLAMVLALSLLFLLRGKGYFLACAAALIIIHILILPNLPRHNDRVLNDSVRLYDDKNDVALRYTEWQAATVMIEEHPLLGVGIGNYQDNIGGYFGVLPRPTGTVEPDSENLYLVLAASMGLPGLACFLGILLTFAALAARHYFTVADPRARGLALGLMGALGCFSICCIWNPLLVRGIGVQLAIIMALTLKLSTEKAGE
jgi:O-antigen ligase